MRCLVSFLEILPEKLESREKLTSAFPTGASSNSLDGICMGMTGTGGLASSPSAFTCSTYSKLSKNYSKFTNIASSISFYS